MDEWTQCCSSKERIEGGLDDGPDDDALNSYGTVVFGFDEEAVGRGGSIYEDGAGGGDVVVNSD